MKDETKLYVVGRCDKCGRVLAAAVFNGKWREGDFAKEVVEEILSMTHWSLDVRVLEGDHKVVTQKHKRGCTRA